MQQAGYVRFLGVNRRMTISHLLAALAWLGLTLVPLATPAAAMVMPMEIAAGVETTSMDMPDGMPCCPETQRKPDCAKNCPFMAVCAGMAFPAVTGGAALSAPVAVLAVIAPRDNDKLSGLAQGPPARPPKA